MKRGRIAVARPMEPALSGPRPIPQIPCCQGRRVRLQFAQVAGLEAVCPATNGS